MSLLLDGTVNTLISGLSGMTTEQITSFVDSLTDDERLIVSNLLKPKWSKYIPSSIQPTPKQLLFLLAQNKEVLFGGSAGGGKTTAMLVAALQYADVPKYSGIIIMKNYPNLEHIINESKEWLYDSDAKWNEVKHIWEFPGGGRLQFGNVDKEDDVFKYRTFQYQFMGFDEVTRLSGDQYLKLTSRMRKTNNMQVPIRIRAATNPGGGVAGHTFIKERFISEDTRHPKTLFIPSNIHDNPHLDAEDYIETLMELPLVERERLLNGNWDIADTGSLIDQGWFVKVTEPEQSVWEKTVRVWDIAATVESAANADPDWTAGALCSFKDGKFTVEDINYFRGTPKTVEEKIIAQYEIDKELFGRPIQTFIEMGMNSAAKIAIDSYLRGPFSGFDIRAISSNISKEERARSFMVAAENGLVNLVVAGWNKRFFEECLLFGSGLRRAKDDGIDAVVHGFNRLVVQGSRRGRVSSMAARRAVSSKSLLHVVRR